MVRLWESVRSWPCQLHSRRLRGKRPSGAGPPQSGTRQAPIKPRHRLAQTRRGRKSLTSHQPQGGAAKKGANPGERDHHDIDAKKAEAERRIAFARRSSRFSRSSSASAPHHRWSSRIVERHRSRPGARSAATPRDAHPTAAQHEPPRHPTARGLAHLHDHPCLALHQLQRVLPRCRHALIFSKVQSFHQTRGGSSRLIHAAR